MSARTRRDWILMGALGCALVGTAHAEYTLALAAHFNKYVALAVPGALDLYVLRALQVRRDVFVAVLAMVAANVTAHLLTAGVLEEHWAITSAAGALAPLILWRVHSLKHTRNRKELLLGLPAGAVTSTPEYSAPVSEYSAPDHVPASWMEEEYPETYPSAPHPCTLSEPFLRDLDSECSECGCRWGDHPGVQAKRAAHPVRYSDDQDPSAFVLLKAVPDLPPEYAEGAVHSESPLKESDMAFLAGAQEYVDYTDKPSVRGLKAALSVGQERAERLLTHLGVLL